MQISIKTNFPEVQRALDRAAKQVPYAMAVALNKTTEWAATYVRKEMSRVFHRPTPWFLRSLRIIRATKQKQESVLWFKSDYNADHMVVPHIGGGKRHHKSMEVRLQRAGLLPAGWQVVPGQGADLDSYGNMSRGQISQLLNVLGTYREAGYNKANYKTIKRLAMGNAKKGRYGFVYWVNPVGGSAKHLPPGVYKRVQTGFGSSLKPILIFVRGTTYRKRLDFYGITQRAVDKHFPLEFDKAFEGALRTARL